MVLAGKGITVIVEDWEEINRSMPDSQSNILLSVPSSGFFLYLDLQVLWNGANN